jgi:hypothetical protein
MFKHLGTAFLALFTLIMWSAAVIGTLDGWFKARLGSPGGLGL